VITATLLSDFMRPPCATRSSFHASLGVPPRENVTSPQRGAHGTAAMRTCVSLFEPLALHSTMVGSRCATRSARRRPVRGSMPALPIHRGNVNAWDCDENGHLNMRFFVAKANDGLPFVLAALGAGPAVLARHGARPRVLRQHVRFLREARVATPLVGLAGVCSHAPDRLGVYSEIRHTLTGEVLAALVTEVGITPEPGHPAPRWPTPSPALRCQIPAHGAPRGLTEEPVGPPARAALAELGFGESVRGRVASAECDAAGELEPYQYVGRVSDAAVNLLSRFQTAEELARRAAGVEGGAVLELRIVHHAPLRASSLFTLHSGVKAVGRKTQHNVHLFFDEESSACAASCEVVAVAMDLRARRAIDLPEARRRRIEAGLLEPWGVPAAPTAAPSPEEAA
jgi:acyl-CoA thioester hydrolase